MPHLGEHGFETGHGDAVVAAPEPSSAHCAVADVERCCPPADARERASATPRTVRSPHARDDD